MFLVCRLVGVRQATHARHDAEHVVVHRIHADLRRASRAHRVDRDRQLKRRLVNAREVARARRLVLLRLERERVDADAHRRRARVVLERLDAVEVASLTLREAVLAVELELRHFRRVLALALHARREHHLREQVVRRVLVERCLVVAARAGVRVEPRRATQRGAHLDTHTREVGARGTIRRRRHHVRRRTATQRATREDVRHHALRGEVVRVVEGLHAVHLLDEDLVGRAIHIRVALDNPHELLDGVVEVQLDLVRRGRDRLRTRELKLLNQILVRLLREPATLLRVEVDIVNPERRRRERLDGRGRRAVRRLQLVVGAVDPLLELDVDAHLVVLERNERDRKTRVAAEPELERDVERLCRRARTRGARVRELGARARRIELVALRVLHQHEVVRVADHVVKRRDRARILRELRPDLHPVAILAVNTLAANLELDRLDEAVANVVEPAEAVDRRRHGNQVDRRENHLDVRAVHQVRIAVDDRRHALVEVRLAVERHLNGLQREVRMPLVQHLPERDLGVARDVDILRTIRDKLKQTTTHSFV